MDGAALAREYYRSIDEDDYDALAGILSGGFVHYRPDRTIEGREAFVAFMRSGRPERDTTHVVDSVYTTRGVNGNENRDADGNEKQNVAVEGRLLDADGDTWFRFVDTFDIGGDGIASIRTYTGPSSGSE